MLIWLLELILTVIVIFTIASYKVDKVALTMGCINVIYHLFTVGFGFGLVWAFVQGLIYGVCAWIVAKIAVFLMEVLGVFGRILVWVLIIGAFLAIIGIL